MTKGRYFAIARSLILLSLFLSPFACDCGPELLPNVPSLVVTPEKVELDRVAISQDTLITLTLDNPSSVTLEILEVTLAEDGDPAFRIVSVPDEVLPGVSAKIEVMVRPLLANTIETTVFIKANPNAEPSEAEVPLCVTAVDLGLPDIVVEPAEIDFGRIGQFDVARRTITITNVGIRDLLIDQTGFIPTQRGDLSIRTTTPISPGDAIAPQESRAIEVVFIPEDTVEHTGYFRILSNDPDEPEVRVPARGKGSECPVAIAELLEDADDLEPLDTIRLDAAQSVAGTPGNTIAAWEWTVLERPLGSQGSLGAPAEERTELTLDLAGSYRVGLTVFDNEGVRSCEDEVIELFAKPTDELHIQLVWDHGVADLDLHLLREAGGEFDPETDVYFSSKFPEWFVNEDENPRLDQDDDEGYGPENINIGAPALGSTWRVLVHYFNQNEPGDPFLVATLRIYAYGFPLGTFTQNFEADETMWRAIEITWPDVLGEEPTITQIGIVEPYERPF